MHLCTGQSFTHTCLSCCILVLLFPQELEEVNNKRIKAQMTSVKHDRPHIHTGKEQEIQMLQQKLTTVSDDLCLKLTL